MVSAIFFNQAEVQNIVSALNSIISSNLGLVPILVLLPKVVMAVGFTVLMVGLANEDTVAMAR